MEKCLSQNLTILLPGINKQIEFLLNQVEVKGKSVLVIGSESAEVGKKLYIASGEPVDIIIEDYDSLINSNLQLQGFPKVKTKLMDFELTDYQNETFDIIFTQGGIGDFRRNKIFSNM